MNICDQVFKRPHLKVSKILAVMKHYKKHLRCTIFIGNSNLENLPVNNENLVLVKEFIFGKMNIRSSYLNFPEEILTTVKTHFIPEHISFSLFWFSLNRLVRRRETPISSPTYVWFLKLINQDFISFI